MLGIGASRSLTISGTIGNCGVDADAPERNAGAVVKLEAVRERRLEIAVERGLEQMTPERRVALQPLVREHLAHERLGRPVVLVADADADRRQVADEEVDPVIGRDDDQQIGPAGAQPPADLVEAGGEPPALAFRQRVPITRDNRPMACRERTDELAMGGTAPCLAVERMQARDEFVFRHAADLEIEAQQIGIDQGGDGADVILEQGLAQRRLDLIAVEDVAMSAEMRRQPGSCCRSKNILLNQ